MKFDAKINFLKSLIETTLLPFIDHDYVLWGLPYHSNVGDMLIWEGEEAFLRKTGYKCLNRSSQFTCAFPILSPDTIILLEGGGDFGDLWRWVQEFRLEVIERYPENKIIILPESVHYRDVELMRQDADKMARHPKLILCARDKVSEKILRTHFKNQVLLLPDMAFCIPTDYLRPKRLRQTDRVLVLKRKDKELGPSDLVLENILDDMEVRDWPSMEKNTILFKIFGGISIFRQQSQKHGWLNWLSPLLAGIENFYAHRILKPHLIKQGVEFVSQYKWVYTTRLHVLILAVLLGQKVSFWDNSYKKNSTFYDTWLRDLSDIKEIDT